MKKKIIITLTICLFAAGSIINVHLAQHEYNMDFTLADISVMAQAGTEYPERNDRNGWCEQCMMEDPETGQWAIGVQIYCYNSPGGLCIDTSCSYGSCD